MTESTVSAVGLVSSVTAGASVRALMVKAKPTMPHSHIALVTKPWRRGKRARRSLRSMKPKTARPRAATPTSSDGGQAAAAGRR